MKKKPRFEWAAAFRDRVQHCYFWATPMLTVHAICVCDPTRMMADPAWWRRSKKQPHRCPACVKTLHSAVQYTETK